MNVSRMIVAQLLSTFAFVLADEWTVLPPPPAAPPPPAIGDSWDVLPMCRPPAFDWSVLTLPEAPPPAPAAPNPKPARPCKPECACGQCECGADCYCCSPYKSLETTCLKTKTGALLYIGTRPEDADATRREAKARGLHFMAVAQLSGVDERGQRVPFPRGVSELTPIKGELYFVPREKRRIPRPDRERSALDRIASPLDCPTGT